MKSYPEIPNSNGTKFQRISDAHVFDKLDGSNLRFEWNKKKGWSKFGTRNRLFDETDLDFGPAIKLFADTLATPLEAIIAGERWDRVIFFAEYWGVHSFAGKHLIGEPMDLTLFDAAPYKKGLIGPKEFLKLFPDKVPTPRYLGQCNWTRTVVDTVRKGEMSGVTFEGVVAKAGIGHGLIMTKAKTQAWIDRIKETYAASEANSLIYS